MATATSIFISRPAVRRGAYFEQGSNDGGTGHPPHIASTSPTDNATGVSSTSNLDVTFTKSVSKGSSGNIEIVKVPTARSSKRSL